MGISFGRIAFYNTVWLNVAWALAAIASVVSEVINDPKWQGLENIAAIILVILVIPAFLDWALNRRGNRWAIRLVKDDIPIKYLAGAAVPFIFGFFWRYCLIFVILIYPVNLNVVAVYGTKLAPVVNIIIGFVGSNLAFYWLYKYPLGSLKIQQYDRSLLPELSIGTLTSVEVENSVSLSMDYLVNAIISFVGLVFVVSYIGIGLVQFAAIIGYFQHVLGWWLIPSIFVSGVVTYIPIVGGCLGIYAAHEIWHWSWVAAAALFCFPIVLGGILILFVGTGALIESFFKARN